MLFILQKLHFKSNNVQHFALILLHILILSACICIKFKSSLENLNFYSAAFLLTKSKGLKLLYASFFCNIIAFLSSLISEALFGPLSTSDQNVYNERAIEFLSSCAMTAVSYSYCLKTENLVPFCIFYAFRSLSWIYQLNSESNRHSNMNYYALAISLTIPCVLYQLVDRFALIFMSFSGLLAFEYCLCYFSLVKTLILNLLSNEASPTSIFIVNVCYILARLTITIYYANNLSKFRVPITYIKMIVYDIHKLKKKSIVFYNYLKLCKDLQNFPDVETNEMCAICTEDTVKGKKLGCNHIFHTDCLKMWCERESTCPVCRKPLSFKKEVIIETENEVITTLPL